ncbi:MAG TPA: SlyX family protein [Rhodanobacteraceae bacterium]|jgi:SlyX protein|nr:SlyX family protein [Rhodanobacteraceae bacterium]
MTATLDERLTELEVRLSFVDDTIASLNATVSEHDRVLADMRVAIERLRGELTGVRTALAHDARDEPPPPHY